MLWNVKHQWPVGAWFSFNCYNNWEQLILIWPGKEPVVILIREGVTQGEPLSMVLYGITLIPLTKELHASDPALMAPFYTNDAEFDGSAQRGTWMLILLLERGTARG